MSTHPAASTPEGLAVRLERYATAIERSPHNLVSRRAVAELRTRHIPESLALARRLPPGPARLLDVGSGGGLPGLVVALARPDLAVTLLDATRKKARFLEETATDLGVVVDVVNERAEDALTRLGGTFDLVTARAVASLERLVGWTVPFLRSGGRCYAIKGERWREELAEAQGALDRYGARVVSTPDDREDVGGDAGADPLVVIIART